jgi:hypothetical protein
MRSAHAMDGWRLRSGSRYKALLTMRCSKRFGDGAHTISVNDSMFHRVAPFCR